MTPILSLSDIPELIDLTAAYSNAVLIAALHCIDATGARLGVPHGHPITLVCVTNALVSDRSMGDCQLYLHDGSHWMVSKGRVHYYASARSLRHHVGTNLLSGSVRYDRKEAVERARKAILSAGGHRDGFFLDLDPEVTMSSLASSYIVEWRDPASSRLLSLLSVELDGVTGSLVDLFAYRYLMQPAPEWKDIPFTTRPTAGDGDDWYPSNADCDRLFRLALDTMNRISNTLRGAKTPLPDEIVVKTFLARLELGQSTLLCLLLENGDRLIVGTRPDTSLSIRFSTAFFREPVTTIRPFLGKVTLDKQAMVAVARDAAVKCGLDPKLSLLRRQPKVEYPNTKGLAVITRRLVTWSDGELPGTCEVEVDVGSGSVHSVKMNVPSVPIAKGLLDEMRRVFDPENVRGVNSAADSRR